MSLPDHIRDRQYQMYRESNDGGVSVAVINDPNSPLTVEADLQVGEFVNSFDSVSAVPASSRTQIVSYTVPLDKTGRLFFWKQAGITSQNMKSRLTA